METTTLRDRERPLGRIARVGWRAVSTVAWLIVIAGALLLIVPAIMGWDRYVITGNSMAPEFHRGSVIFSESVPVDDLQVGDIITYLPPATTKVTEYVTHRIVSIEPGDDGRPVFVTKGDNNDTPDPWEFQLGADVQNVVRHDLPVIGHLVAFLSNPSNRILILGVPAGLIALRALIDLVRALTGRPDPVLADEASTHDQVDPVTSEVSAVDVTTRSSRHSVTDRPEVDTEPLPLIDLRDQAAPEEREEEFAR